MKVLFVVPYFGDWPVWFPAFLLSCRYNPKVEWLFLSDSPLPKNSPDNVRRIEASLSSIETRVSGTLGISIELEYGYQMCDLRPAFGELFSNLLEGYDFWGHCDIDVVWGNMARYFSDLNANGCDVISARRGSTCGHCTIYRNVGVVNRMYRRHRLWKEAMCSPVPYYFDETGFTETVRDAAEAGEIEVQWDRYLFNTIQKGPFGPSRLRPTVNRWKWERGEVYQVSGDQKKGAMYLHFMNWKDTIQNCSFGFDDCPERFWISFTHIDQDRRIVPPDSIRGFVDWSAEWLRRVRDVFKARLGRGR